MKKAAKVAPSPYWERAVWLAMLDPRVLIVLKQGMRRSARVRLEVQAQRHGKTSLAVSFLRVPRPVSFLPFTAVEIARPRCGSAGSGGH